MVDQNQSVLNIAQDDIINSDMDKREYKVTIGIRSYWITKEELQKYLAERKRPGVDLVALRNGLLFLPAQCQEIAHRSVIDDSEKIDKGSWQCDAGKWHPVGAECRCEYSYIPSPNDPNEMILVPKNQPTLEPRKEQKREQPASRYLNGSVKSF